MSETGVQDHDDQDHGGRYGPPEGLPYADYPEPALPGLEYESPLRTASTRDLLAEPPQPINWNVLNADEAQVEWEELNRWVHWLRRTYGLPSSVIPPLWHRHPELVWELSALHLHWLCAYDPHALGTAPLSWHREFAEARLRLRDWVTGCGTRTDIDRPTPQATWPGETVDDPVAVVEITNRDEDFVRFVHDDLARRRQSEEEFYAKVAELADRDVRAEQS